jgi:hypothetical protein
MADTMAVDKANAAMLARRRGTESDKRDMKNVT